jgi:hypothetical protein
VSHSALWPPIRSLPGRRRPALVTWQQQAAGNCSCQPVPDQPCKDSQICQAPAAPASGLLAVLPGPRFWGLPVWKRPGILAPS